MSWLRWQGKSIQNLKFEFFQKGRPFIQNGDWSARGVGTLKSIREVAAPKPLFGPDIQHTVIDHRFHDEATGIEANLYTWRQPFAPSADDPRLQAKFKLEVEERNYQKSAK